LKKARNEYSLEWSQNLIIALWVYLEKELYVLFIQRYKSYKSPGRGFVLIIRKSFIISSVQKQQQQQNNKISRPW
jgi:hypothetical protein